MVRRRRRRGEQQQRRRSLPLSILRAAPPRLIFYYWLLVLPPSPLPLLIDCRRLGCLLPAGWDGLCTSREDYQQENTCLNVLERRRTESATTTGGVFKGQPWSSLVLNDTSHL
jgi:hypothetical protein